MAFANTERLKYKQEWREGEKVGKVTLLRDIDISNPHTGHQRIINQLRISATGKSKVDSFASLYEYWQSVFSVSILNKKFYEELFNWYLWAIKEVRFPSEPDVEIGQNIDTNRQEHNAKNIIRLLTRFLFVWFIKEKKLIPEELFQIEYIENNLLKEVSPYRGDHFLTNQRSCYYKAVLQNLFFATLNQEGKRAFRRNRQNTNVTNLLRYESLFKSPDNFIKLVEASVPFMNGGLFECLDKPHPTQKGKQGGDVIIYEDGFSDRPDNKLIVPDYLFFGMDEKIDLSAEYDSKAKKYKQATVKGLIKIFESYKFTIAENTPIEEDVALDPELLGKVFENLLASYNPETKTTARKQTGSFYTPREIVSYMVDESLIAYLKGAIKNWEGIEELDKKLHELLSFDAVNPFEDNDELQMQIIKALDQCTILDPACGSGAFPMGILQKMTHLLGKLDPRNEKWKQRQIDRVKEAIESVERIDDAIFRDSAKKELNNQAQDIEEAFKSNELDYGRKLYLIENCLYGVDIQPIAVQISKLRFFISLVVDQRVDKSKNNFGIRPLPNLETKFVAANTLIGIDDQEEQMTFDNPEIKKLESELVDIRHRIFSAKSPPTKKKWRDKDKEVREKIGKLLVKDGWASKTANQLAGWDPYDQNESSEFFDPEWMFGIKNGFDIVIGNPPYVESRNSKLFSVDKKEAYQKNTNFRWGDKCRLITRGADLLIYFFEFSLKHLNDNGVNSLITQNAWLATDYGKKFQEFLLLLDIEIQIDDSNLKHFSSLEGPNINTIISFFRKNLASRSVLFSSVDIAKSDNTSIVTNEQLYNWDDPLLKYKWGTLFKSPSFVIDLFRIISESGSFTNYSIGQGLNITKSHYVTSDKAKELNFDDGCFLSIMTNDEGAPYILTSTSQYIINGDKLDSNSKAKLKDSGIDVCQLSNTRSMPSLILPRGLGRYFAALNTIPAYSASFVEIYTEKSRVIIGNLRLFLNSSIGFLIREVSGRSNLGGGMLKAEATDLKSFPLYHDFNLENDIHILIEESTCIQSQKIVSLLESGLHQKIDKIVFSHFNIDIGTQRLIKSYLQELVTMRENKSKS